mgnify:CR=1 FL=1
MRRPGDDIQPGIHEGKLPGLSERVEIGRSEIVGRRHTGTPADNHFSQRLRPHARGDVDKRRIVSGAFQLRAVARLALLVVQYPASRDCRRSAGSPPAGRAPSATTTMLKRRPLRSRSLILSTIAAVE